MSLNSMSIGQVAKHTGVSAHTLRYYEKIQMLEKIKKNAAGNRVYDSEAINRILFIKRAQSMQFTLEEIKQLIKVDQNVTLPKPEARAMVQKKLHLIDQRLKELQTLKENLSDLLSACQQSNQIQACPILENIKGEPQ